MGIEYDSSKTPQEMAEGVGVSLTDVRNFLQRNPICNYRADRANYCSERVKEFLSRNPDASEKDAAEALKMSLPTVKKYLRFSLPSTKNNVKGKETLIKEDCL